MRFQDLETLDRDKNCFQQKLPLAMENYAVREPDEKRQRKRTSFDPVTCPVCGVTIRESELEHHFHNELEKLNRIKRIVNKSPSTSPASTSKSKLGEASGSSKTESEENCWETFQKIKENRVRRSSKVSKTLASESSLISTITAQKPQAED